MIGFLHPEAEAQAGDMLGCFAKVAATTLYLRWAPGLAGSLNPLLGVLPGG
jgi:hypothetical protein